MGQNHRPDLGIIRAVAFDIDGVMTDGSLIPMEDGNVLRIMNAKDAFAVRALTGKGLTTAIISGGCTEALRLRCLSLKVREENIYLKARGKMVLMEDFCKRNGFTLEEVAYFGDDIPDVPLLRACGAGFVPSDAVPEAVAAADFVLTLPGGRGAVREGVEMILKAQGKWVFEEDTHATIF